MAAYLSNFITILQAFFPPKCGPHRRTTCYWNGCGNALFNPVTQQSATRTSSASPHCVVQQHYGNVEDLSLPHVFLGNPQESAEFVESTGHSVEFRTPQIWLEHLPNSRGISISFHGHSSRFLREFHSVESFSRNP